MQTVAACKSTVNINAHGKTLSCAAIQLKCGEPLAPHAKNMRRLLLENGVLVVKNAVPKETISNALRFVLSHARRSSIEKIGEGGGGEGGDVESHGANPASSAFDPESCTYSKLPSLLSRMDIAFNEKVVAATAHQNVLEILDLLFQSESDDTTSIDKEEDPKNLRNSSDTDNSSDSDCSYESESDSDSSDSKLPIQLRPPPPYPSFPRVTQIPHAWLRAVSTGKCTGPHLDRVYLGAGSQRLLTVWMPFTDVPIEKGALCVALESHKREEFHQLRSEYGSKPAGREGSESGWISQYPDRIQSMYGLNDGAKEGRENVSISPSSPSAECAPGLKRKANDNPSVHQTASKFSKANHDVINWVSMDFEMGDIAIFGLDLLHMTVNNVTDQWRVSCETRWQPTGDPYPPFFHKK
ncbi:hypothetical protein HDU77_005614 [Chytriomyces hyalinus]|nr:hypothetical protein HDU77_005614 [Chytriomyces hyalinus]